MEALLRSFLAKGKMVCECLRAGRFDILCYKLHNYWKDLDLRPANVEELAYHINGAHWYSDSGGPDLARIVQALRVPSGSRAIDIGSGKGGAVMTLSTLHFDEVVGIELSSDLTEVAKANAKRLGLRNVRYLTVNAVDYKGLDDFTHIYMYNPFPCDVMRTVINNLAESLVRKQRSLTLIYKNPVCHQTIVDSGLFDTNREYSFRLSHHPFRVYFHSANASAREATD